MDQVEPEYAMFFLLLMACGSTRFAPTANDREPADCSTSDKIGLARLCAMWKPSFPTAATPDATCVDPLSTLDPVEDWAWSELDGVEMSVLATPVVGPLEDADGDGLSDATAVVALALSDDEWELPGTLVALRGVDGTLLWAKDVVVDGFGVEHRFSADGGVALGDLTGDGSVEVCASGYDEAVVCVDRAGDFVMAGDAGDAVNEWHSAPAILDMDDDAVAEVTIGEHIFAADGTLVGAGAHGTGGGTLCCGARYDVSVPADLDLDGHGELVTGNAVYDETGATVWVDSSAADGEDGWPAVLNLDEDAALEIVVSRRDTDAMLVAYDTDGTKLWDLVNGTAYRSGPPTVGNFDGDPDPEVAVASDTGVRIYDVVGAPALLVDYPLTSKYQWSSTSGLAAFDLTGDGVDELVYEHESRWYVWDVAAGVELLDLTTSMLDPLLHQSGTQLEYPAIADVDDDGTTEIVLPSHRGPDYASVNGASDWAGIHVIGSRLPWSTTRPMWSQHAWYGDHIDDDGTVVSGAPDGHHFRAQVVVDPGGEGLANLSLLGPQKCPWACTLAKATSKIKFHVALVNDGLAAAGAFTVTLYDYAGTALSSAGYSGLASGAVQNLSFAVNHSAWSTTDHPYVIVDSLSAVEECDEADNVLDLGAWPCP